MHRWGSSIISSFHIIQLFYNKKNCARMCYFDGTSWYVPNSCNSLLSALETWDWFLFLNPMSDARASGDMYICKHIWYAFLPVKSCGGPTPRTFWIYLRFRNIFDIVSLWRIRIQRALTRVVCYVCLQAYLVCCFTGKIMRSARPGRPQQHSHQFIHISQRNFPHEFKEISLQRIQCERIFRRRK